MTMILSQPAYIALQKIICLSHMCQRLHNRTMCLFDVRKPEYATQHMHVWSQHGVSFL